MGLDMTMYRADNSIEVPAYPSEVPAGFGAELSEDEQKQVDSYWDEVNGLYDKMEDVAYWRKFNALHAWIVENVQDGQDACQYSEISKEVLEDLTLLLAKSIEDEVPVLIPQGGFFFGSTEIDEYYWGDVKNALVEITNIIDTTDFDTQKIYYHASW